jgi:hypothetical protein
MRKLVGIALLSLLAASRPPEKAFTDLTKESGIEEGVAVIGATFPRSGSRG